VHLKRFDNRRRKIRKHINFKTSLDLSNLMENKAENHKYKLISMIVHEGFSTNSGHYYCYIRNSNDIWYCMNDSKVTKVSLEHVLLQNPYLLFYEKEVDFNSNVISPYSNKSKTSILKVFIIFSIDSATIYKKLF